MTRGSAISAGPGEGWLGPTEASPVASSARQKYRSYLPESLQCRTLLPCARRRTGLVLMIGPHAMCVLGHAVLLLIQRFSLGSSNARPRVE